VLSALSNALLFALMGVLSAQMAWDEFRYDETSPAIGVPKWWYTVWLPIFCGVVCARALQRYQRLRGPA
jgi:TRAP-type C4-dicarboxylate transport system permease small subunit